MNRLHTAVFSFFLLLLSTPASDAAARRETLPGPLSGEVLQVLDGDTVSVRLHVWIGQNVETLVRINGIDTPEIKGKCAEERKLAQDARDTLADLLGDGKIRLYNVKLEKYAGRVLADAQNADGIVLGEHLIHKGLARAYHGKKRQPWCG